MHQRRGRGAAAELAEALQGMSSGRQPHVNLYGLDSDLVLVAGSGDQKFVRLAQSMTHQVHGPQGTASTGISNGTVNSSGQQPLIETVAQKPRRTCCVVQNCGHAVHVERSEALVHILQSLLEKAVGSGS